MYSRRNTVREEDSSRLVDRVRDRIPRTSFPDRLCVRIQGAVVRPNGGANAPLACGFACPARRRSPPPIRWLRLRAEHGPFELETTCR